MEDYTRRRRGPPVVAFCEWEYLDTGCAITQTACMVLLLQPCVNRETWILAVRLHEWPT